MRYLILLLLVLSGFSLSAQKVVISGYAPEYVGQEMKVFRIKDYLSDQTTLISSATVAKDSTFELSFFSEEIEKVILRCDNNRSHLYIEPGATYSVFFPERNKYEPKLPSGNTVELTFYDLDSLDINYKILRFQRWYDYFVGGTYHLRNDKEAVEFAAYLDTFKTNVYNYYLPDTSENSFFLKTYIRYSIAGLDNINTLAERGRYEKYDFYLEKYPVCYKNDIYMDYMTAFYDKTIHQLHRVTSEKFYQGVVQSSPTMIYNALGAEYTLSNMKLRELVMIQSLAEAYYSDEYPKTNIETILDSLSQNCLFEAHEDIAKNVLDRLTDLVPGGKAPNFVLHQDESSPKTLLDYKDKHLYIHFLDPRIESNMRELEIMKDMHTRYKDYVQFLTIYPKYENSPKSSLEKLKELPWDSFEVEKDHSILERYQVVNFAQFVLIDAAGNIVASPAPKPTPDGEYDTIDRTFYYLKQQMDQGN
ncbi:MAG: TlpA family protein disulfide reductase [Fluviicola sp.]